jgi:dehydrogenase/reductase SDR family protein 12
MQLDWPDTPGVQTSLPTFRRFTRRSLRTPKERVDTILWLAVDPAVAGTSGRFWFDRQERTTHLLPCTHSSARDRQRLLDECMGLSGLVAQRLPDAES